MTGGSAGNANRMETARMSIRKWTFSLAVAALLALAACNGEETGKAGTADTGADSADSGAKEVSQVIAKVGKTEVTVHQLNVELAQLGQVADPDLARRQALEAIVYRTALAQAAQSDKLDRNPDVLIQVQALKDKTLAEAYLRSQTATTPAPTATEIDDFMLQNPMMFDRRRVYDFQRMVMPTMAFSDELKPFIDGKTDLTELETELKRRGTQYNFDEVSIGSGQFPADVQARLPTYAEGDSLILHGDNTIAVLKILKWIEAPLPREQSAELAKNILFQQAVQKRAATTRDRILGNADVSFYGEFEDMKINGPISLEPAQPAAAEETPAAPPVAAPAEGDGAAPATSEDQ